jgi:hypothetical protein
VLKENVINKLMTFERKIRRKIYGATGIGGDYWRVKYVVLQEQTVVIGGLNMWCYRNSR